MPRFDTEPDPSPFDDLDLDIGDATARSPAPPLRAPPLVTPVPSLVRRPALNLDFADEVTRDTTSEEEWAPPTFAADEPTAVDP